MIGLDIFHTYLSYEISLKYFDSKIINITKKYIEEIVQSGLVTLF